MPATTPSVSPIAIFALCVSCITLALGVIAHIWARRSYNKTGPQITVELKPAIWLPGMSVAQWDSPTGAIPLSDDSRLGHECAILVIENGGRTPVTVSEPGIAFRGKRQGLRRKFRRTHHFITPRMFDPGSSSPSTVTESPIRLEAFHAVSYLLDVHTVLNAARKFHPEAAALHLRGQVRIPGPKRYPRGARWRVPRNAATLVGYGTRAPVSRLILRSLLVEGASGVEVSELEYTARTIAAHLWAHSSGEHLTKEACLAAVEFAVPKYHEDTNQPVGVKLIAFNIERTLEAHVDQLDWEGAERQWELNQAAAASRERRACERET